jgi:putative iron-dependent peroxidase
MTTRFQPGVLAPPPRYGRSISYTLEPGADPRPALRRLAAVYRPENVVLGLGESLALALGATIPGLKTFPALAAPVPIPSTPFALWLFVSCDGRDEVFDCSRALDAALAPEFLRADAVDTFAYRQNRDLTGYEDGTENPTGEKAVAAALPPQNSPLAGSSFAAVQRWAHDLDHFERHSTQERDAMIGRRIADNEEIEDAPESAHVKRTAQESFAPPAFMVRRSHSWAGPDGQGLEFIAYVAALDTFETMLKRMAGLEDGVTDALFRFSRPVNGAYYWCPPLKDGKPDFSRIGL